MGGLLLRLPLPHEVHALLHFGQGVLPVVLVFDRDIAVEALLAKFFQNRIWASDQTPDKLETEVDVDRWRKELRDFYSGFKADLSKFKFNRDELYDRP